MRYTPGPWVVLDGERILASSDPKNKDASYNLLAEVYDPAKPDFPQTGRTVANAKLIAAAPDLYDVALAFDKFLEMFEKGSFAELLESEDPGIFKVVSLVRSARGHVNSAMAKARGEL